MIVIETRQHFTFDSRSVNPELACQGLCRKVWWHEDLENREAGVCPLCGGSLSSAVEKTHYSVLRCARRPLKLSDFTAYIDMSHQYKLTLKRFLQNSVVSSMSNIKPQFEQLARETWCNPKFTGANH